MPNEKFRIAKFCSIRRFSRDIWFLLGPFFFQNIPRISLSKIKKRDHMVYSKGDKNECLTLMCIKSFQINLFDWKNVTFILFETNATKIRIVIFELYIQQRLFSFHFQVYFVCEKVSSNCNKTNGYFHQWKLERQKQSLWGVLQKLCS